MTAKENLMRAIFRKGPRWVPNGMESVVTVPNPVVERPPGAGRDAFGVLWEYDEGAEGGTYPAHGGHVISDITRWREALILPDIDRLDWAGVTRFAQGIDRETHWINGFVEMGLFERSYLLLGMESALIAYLEESEEMAALLHVLADYKINVIRRYHQAAGLDMIWYGDDWGTQTNLFLPVATWRAIIRPETQRIYRCMQELGIWINQHSCGKVDSILPDMIEMGAAMWNPCQPCNDLVGLKRQYGDLICFIGGIDSQFVLDRPGVTPPEVEAEVKRRIGEMAAGGGYIAAPSHSVPYDPQLLEAMNRAIDEHGRYAPCHDER